MSATATLAVDVGGTFTDAVVTGPAGVFTAKTPTTPQDQSLGVMTAAAEALAAAGLTGEDVADFVHGMTVTTNAMLEGRFARTALLTTAGFEDLEELGRQNRADLYRLEAAGPAPIVPPQLRFGLVERCGPQGVIEALDHAQARDAVERAVELGAQSLAVCLLFAFRHPQHELALREIARDVAPGVHVSLSHEAVGTFREYERCATTIADAALSPLLTGYLERLTARAGGAGLPEPQVMLSGGGTVPARTAAHNASWTVLSGPAGGAVGAARSAQRRRAARAIAFDMGGTSTDISLVVDGAVAVSAERAVAGRPLALPAVDISTVGAGGGSLAWRDSGGALRVGPRSAGASPGPACYGRGGDQPTVSDANLLLGRLGAESPLAGGLTLDHDAARAAVTRLGESLGMTALETAAGIVEIANLEMLRAITAITVARGIDPRGHALIAFGGAGPMHAAEVAEKLGVSNVVCPASCGVLSALGMAVAGRRRDRSRSIVRPLAEIPVHELVAVSTDLAAAATGELALTPQDVTVATSYELRYRGQAFELAVEAPHERLAEAFHAAHAERFGFEQRDAVVELVTVRVSLTSGGTQAAGPPAAASTLAGGAPRPARDVHFAGRPHSTRVFAALPQDETISGPLLIEQAQTTIVVPPGWSARTHDGDVLLERQVTP